MFKKRRKFVQELAADARLCCSWAPSARHRMRLPKRLPSARFYIKPALAGRTPDQLGYRAEVGEAAKELDEMATDGRLRANCPKKEVIKLERERKHLQAQTWRASRI